jgi:hypothetical protein
MWIVCAAVAAGMTIRAIKPERLSHWWDFSRLASVLGICSTFALLFLVSWLGISAAGVLSGGRELSLAQEVAAALTAQASLRRAGSSSRGETLALGLIPDVHRWIDHFVRLRISKWAEAMSDQDLVSAAARLDDKSKGIPTRSSLEQRAAWREQSVAQLREEGSRRDEARQDLIRLVITGYSTYAMRRQR